MKDLARKKLKKNPNGTYLAYNAAKDIEEGINLSKYLVQNHDNKSVSISLCTGKTLMPELAVVDSIDVARHIINIFDYIEYYSQRLIIWLKENILDISPDQRNYFYKEFIARQKEILRYRDQLDDKTVLNLKYIDSYEEIINITETYRIENDDLLLKYDDFFKRFINKLIDKYKWNNINLIEDISRDRYKYIEFCQLNNRFVVARSTNDEMYALLVPRNCDNDERKYYSDFNVIFEGEGNEPFQRIDIIRNIENCSVVDYLCSISMGMVIIEKFKDELKLAWYNGQTPVERKIAKYDMKYGLLSKQYNAICRIMDYIPEWAIQHLYDTGVLKEINKKLKHLGVTDLYTMKGTVGRHKTGRRYIKYWVSTEEDAAIKNLLEKMRYPDGRNVQKSCSKEENSFLYVIEKWAKHKEYLLKRGYNLRNGIDDNDIVSEDTDR